MLKQLGLAALRPKHALSARLSRVSALRSALRLYSKSAPRPQPPTPPSVPRASLLARINNRITRWESFNIFSTPSRLASWFSRNTANLTRWGLFTLNLFLVSHLIETYILTIRPCIGPSMLPNISWRGDYILISRLHRHGWHVEVGDLVSYWHPVRQGYKGIKRVVGMPGDFVLRDTPGLHRGEVWMVQVPEGHCWIAGDNLEASRDSRHFGPLPLALVRGKVLGRVWPRPGWFLNGLQEVEDGLVD